MATVTRFEDGWEVELWGHKVKMADYDDFLDLSPASLHELDLGLDPPPGFEPSSRPVKGPFAEAYEAVCAAAEESPAEAMRDALLSIPAGWRRAQAVSWKGCAGRFMERSPLHLACLSGIDAAEKVRILREEGLCRSVLGLISGPGTPDSLGNVAMHYAAASGDPDLLKEMGLIDAQRGGASAVWSVVLHAPDWEGECEPARDGSDALSVANPRGRMAALAGAVSVQQEAIQGAMLAAYRLRPNKAGCSPLHVLVATRALAGGMESCSGAVDGASDDASSADQAAPTVLTCGEFMASAFTEAAKTRTSPSREDGLAALAASMESRFGRRPERQRQAPAQAAGAGAAGDPPPSGPYRGSVTPHALSAVILESAFKTDPSIGTERPLARLRAPGPEIINSVDWQQHWAARGE